MEEWKPLYERYEVSNMGNIRTIETGKLLRTRKPDFLGYCRVTLLIDGKQTTKTVHRLVASAFIPNPKGKKHVHHKNGDKTDNSVANLEWVDEKEHGEKDKELRKKEGRHTKHKENRLARQKMSY